MLKIGVLGAGHLGKIHLKCIKLIPEYQLIGFYDADKENAAQVAQTYGVKSFNSIDEIVEKADVVDIVTPTVSHYQCAAKALKKSKHVFIEKPLTTTIEEAADLIKIAEEAHVKVQVGHVERFNPAFIAAMPFFNAPMFIENHRLAQFNPRGTDVPVILDLMIHDIDIILSVVKSDIKKVHASGVSVISDTPDIANARIEFENGCVANLTASRISLKNMRKSRFFQKDAYIAIDFLKKDVEIVKMEDAQNNENPFAITIDPGNDKPAKQLFFEKPKIKDTNAIEMELKSFYNAIMRNEEPPVSIHDGYKSLELAHHIIQKINKNKI